MSLSCALEARHLPALHASDVEQILGSRFLYNDLTVGAWTVLEACFLCHYKLLTDKTQILLVKILGKQLLEKGEGNEESAASGADSLRTLWSLVNLTYEVASITVLAHPMPAILNTDPLLIRFVLLVARLTQGWVWQFHLPNLKAKMLLNKIKMM